jgi:hypothetical protein
MLSSIKKNPRSSGHSLVEDDLEAIARAPFTNGGLREYWWSSPVHLEGYPYILSVVTYRNIGDEGCEEEFVVVVGSESSQNLLCLLPTTT